MGNLRDLYYLGDLYYGESEGSVLSGGSVLLGNLRDLYYLGDLYYGESEGSVLSGGSVLLGICIMVICTMGTIYTAEPFINMVSCK